MFRSKKQKVETIEVPLKVIELEFDNYHILVEGNFRDGSSVFWVIDTGASKTVLDKNLTNQYELIETDNPDDYQSAGINQGMMETSVGKLSYLSFGDLEIENRKVALIDLSHVNEIYSKYTTCRIAGLLGSDILMQFECKIDYEYKTLKFIKR